MSTKSTIITSFNKKNSYKLENNHKWKKKFRIMIIFRFIDMMVIVDYLTKIV